MDALRAVRAWRRFAETTVIEWRGKRRSWRDHIAGNGYTDEECLVQPVVFPQFAQALLGFTVGENLAAEVSGQEGKPDFTPADAVTHGFVFETKSTKDQAALVGHEAQVFRYLTNGRPRIRAVVLTNLVGIKVFVLNDVGALVTATSVNLRGLLDGPENVIATTGNAARLAAFLDAYSFRELSPAQKLDRVRRAPEWNPITEVTASDWLLRRVDKVVTVLEQDVAARVAGGQLDDPSIVEPSRREQILTEIQLLDWCLGSDLQDAERRSLDSYLRAPEDSGQRTALRQYLSHVAYYAATRLLLVRVWEDLGLLEPVLYDGGFDKWMKAFNDVVGRVVGHSFSNARQRYCSLFEQQNNYLSFAQTNDNML